MGLEGPTTYAQEPPRHPSLKINAKEPFNAEPPPLALINSYITPVEMFFKRNHGPIPVLDNSSVYRLEVGGLAPKLLNLSMEDIRKFPKYTVVATLQCAGNRRTAMSLTKEVRGVGWDTGAVGNGVWGGAKLSDVLEIAGVPYHSAKLKNGGKHVEFLSVDACKEEDGGPYKASVPLIHATSPEADILLAYEMNGQELTRDHGFPLRVVVPGVIGARSVKWLASIHVTSEESQGFYMQKDYKMFPPRIDWSNIKWPTRRPLMDFPVQCAICSPEDGAILQKTQKVMVQGYALSGGGRGIERVDVSTDDGKTWVEAKVMQQYKGGKDNDMVYVPDDDEYRDKWAWVLWEVELQLCPPLNIIAKAVDSAANVQPEEVESIWNLRGVLNNSWHKIHINASLRSNL